MKSKKPAKYISLMIASALSLSVLFFAEYAMDVHATETQDSGQLQVMENTEQLQTEPQDKETTKAESDNESTGSGTDENMAADVNVKATSKTNNIIGEVFANMFNDGDDEKAKAKREASLEEYPFEFHDLDYYGDSLRVRVLEGGDEEGSNYLAYRDSYLLIGEEESGNYSVEFSKDGREAYVSPAIPASELEDKMGVVFLADYVGDDVILVFDGEPAYDGDAMTVPVLTAEDITVNMLFSDGKLSIDQPQAKPQTKKQTKSNGKGISLKADPPGGYSKDISGTNWSGKVTSFSSNVTINERRIDIFKQIFDVGIFTHVELDFDITSTGQPGSMDTVEVEGLYVPAEIYEFKYVYSLQVKFDEHPVHVKGSIKSDLEYQINPPGMGITKSRNPVTLDTFELINPRDDVNKDIRFYIGAELRAEGGMFRVSNPITTVQPVLILDQDSRGGCYFRARHEANQYNETDRSMEVIHTCAKNGWEGCLDIDVAEKRNSIIKATVRMFSTGLIPHLEEIPLIAIDGDDVPVEEYHLYNSLSYKSGFVRGHCPHIFYRLPVSVHSSEGNPRNPLQGMNVAVSDPVDCTLEEAKLLTDTTDKLGSATLYLPYKEDYKYTVVAAGRVYDADVSEEEQQKHNFRRGGNEPVEITLDTDFVNISGKITWEGDEGKEYLRPESVNLYVIKEDDSALIRKINVPVDENGNYEAKKLPRRSQDNEIEYRVIQGKVRGYDSVYTRPSYDEDTRTWTYDIKNLLTGYCAIKIDKKVTGDAPENQEKYTFQVEPINDEVSGAEKATDPLNENIEITGAGDTTVEFLLDMKDTGRFYYKFKEKEGNDPDCKYDKKEWFVIISKQPVWDGDDLRIETKTWVVDDLNNVNLDEAEESDTVTFTNKYPNATVKKEWDIDLEDKDRPESIQVLVQKKSKDKDKWTDVKVIELSEENDWEAKFFREDDSAEYRVRELKEENALTNLINELRTMIKGSASASYEDIINKIKGSEYYNKLPEGVRSAADQGKDKLIKELGTTEAKLYDKLIETLDLAAAADRVVYDEDDSDKPKGKDGKDDPETNAVRYHVDDHHTKYQVSYDDKEKDGIQNYTVTNKAIVEVDVIKRWVTFGVEDEDIPDSAWLVLMCKPNPEALESAKSIPGVDLSDLLDYEFPVINPISGGNNPISIISELVLGIDIDIFGIFDKTTPKLAIAKAEKKDDGEEGNWTVHFTDSKYHMGIPMEYKGAELSSEVIKQIIKYVSKGTINLPISYNPFSNYFSIPTKAIRTIAGITDVNQVLDLSGLSQKLLEKAKGLTVEDVKKFGPENILDDDQLMANVINVKIDSDSNDDPDDEKITISGSKTWDDNNNKAGKRPESITVRLRADGEEKDSKVVTADDDWKWEFKDLPKTDDGDEIKYTISEDAVEDYETTVDGTNITNKYIGKTTSKKQVNVYKVWDDGNDFDGIRPAKVTVKLKANGKDTGKSLELSKDNGWTGSFTGLDVTDESLKDIEYTVEEVKDTVITGTDGKGTYSINVRGNATEGFTITNKHTPEKITISGSKTWDDNNNQAGKRPESITVRLRRDGRAIESQTVTAENGWKWEFKNLDSTDGGGKEIKYTVSEDVVKDYETTVNGTDITNTYKGENSGKTQVNVFKVWNDENNIDGIRPETVTVKLKANGQDTGKTIDLSGSKGWTGSFKDLDVKDGSGKGIDYTVEEVTTAVITGEDGEGTYATGIEGSATEGFTIFNKHTPEKINISGSKTWKDNDNKAGKRPESITVRLRADGKDVDEQTVTAENGWKWEFKDKQKTEGSTAIKYTVSEDAIEDYQTTVDGTNITNKYIDPRKTQVNVFKVWDDNDNIDGIRPDTVTVKLKANDQDTGKTIELSEGNGWRGSFTDLDITDDSLKEITYTVEEVREGVITGTDGEGTYYSTVNGDAKKGFTITNKHTSKLITISGKKTWEDEDNKLGERPDKIRIKILANGNYVTNKDGEVISVETTREGRWKFFFTNLSRLDEQGYPIEYTVEEDKVEGYTTEVRKSSSSDYKFEIINTLKPRVDINVKKEWDDKNDQDGIRPKSVEVKLLKDGEETGKTLTLSERNEWKDSFKNLYKEEDGKAIEYTVKELETDVIKDQDGPGSYSTEVKGGAEEGYTITNKHTPETITLSGRKTWDDNNNQDWQRPESITVRLRADGEEVASRTVTAGEDWKWEFTDLAKYSGGKEIKYALTEDPVENYTPLVEGMNITNTHTPDKTQVSVAKLWDDQGDADGARPGFVTVHLLADGTDTGRTMTISEADGWYGTFTGLDKNENGKEIIYSITEDSVEGYETEILDGRQYDASNIFLIRNTHKPETINIEGKKVWDDNNNSDGKRPEKITIRLYRDGDETAHKEVTAENGWKWSFGELNKNVNGNPSSFTISEDKVEGYVSEVKGSASRGFTVTNKYTPNRTQVNVTGSWDDENDQDGIRPGRVVVKLLADGKETGKIVELSTKNNWTGTFSDLYIKKEGKDIRYTVEQVATEVLTGTDGPGTYANVTSGDAEKGFAISNIHTPERISLSGRKTWEGDQAGNRPGSITVRLRADGEEIASRTVTADDWKWTFERLPKYKGGKKIRYFLTEDLVENYTSTVTDMNVTNVYTPDETQVNVYKLWDDLDNNDGKRPSTIRINLLADGSDTRKSIVLSEANGWMGSFTGLDKTNAGGELIDYTISEDPAGEYEASYVRGSGNQANSWIVVNKREIEKIDISGSKVWDDEDDRDGKRPEKITVRLYLDGVEVENKEVAAEDEWKWTFEGCLKYRDGEEAEYTISEDPVKGYETKIQGDASEGFTVINTHDPQKTSVRVKKDWDDGDDHDNIRPSSITVRLLADGVDTGNTKKLSWINRWKGSFDDLYVYSEGKKIEYTVEEEKTDIVTDEDHEKTYASSVSGDANKGFTVRNVHTPWYTIVYDLNGGEYKGSKADISDRYRAGTVISIHEAPVREGYTFLYWKGSEYHPGDKYKVTEDHKFVAQWKKNKGPNDPNNPNNPNNPNGPDHPEKHTPTGDESHLALWCGVGAMSLLTLLALLAARRRRWE